MYTRYPDAYDSRTGIPSALGASRPFYRHVVDLFICFFRYRIHLCLDRTRGGPARWPVLWYCWPIGKRLTNLLPKLSLITPAPELVRPA